jgi:hypothetical protein
METHPHPEPLPSEWAREAGFAHSGVVGIERPQNAPKQAKSGRKIPPRPFGWERVGVRAICYSGQGLPSYHLEIDLIPELLQEPAAVHNFFNQVDRQIEVMA